MQHLAPAAVERDSARRTRSAANHGEGGSQWGNYGFPSHRRGRTRRDSKGCSAGAASRPSGSRRAARGGEERRSRTASRTGGTCRKPGRGRRGCGARRARRRSRDASRARLPEHFRNALAEPVEAASFRRLRQSRPHDEHVVTRPLRRPGTPGLPQLPFDPVSDDRTPDALRDRDSKSRGVLRSVAVEAVEDQVAGGDGAPMAVDRVEVPGAGEAVPSLHAALLRRETLATLCAAALEDHPAGAGSHPRAEAVLALAAPDVGLVGPLHWRRESSRGRTAGARRKYRRGIYDGCPQRSRRAGAEETRRPGGKSVGGVAPGGVSHRCGNACGRSEIPAICGSSFSERGIVRLRGRWYARPSISTSEGVSATRGAPK